MWFKTVHDVVKSYIPLKSVVIRPRDKPWMNGEVHRAIRKRDSNFTTNLIRSAKQIYYDKLNND